MRILIAPDSYKGSLSALEAARAIQKGMLEVFPEAEIDLSGIDSRIEETEIVVACDVDNPLCGPSAESGHGSDRKPEERCLSL
jgi:glycerate kinase